VNRLALAAGSLGFLAVALGAFGAHGLEGALSAKAHGWWETATFYGLVHAVAALALSQSARSALTRAGWAFIAGAVLFSGSLYAMALMSISGGAPQMLAMITPLGGLCFLAGWAMTVVASVRR